MNITDKRRISAEEHSKPPRSMTVIQMPAEEFDCMMEKRPVDVEYGIGYHVTEYNGYGLWLRERPWRRT